MHEFINACHRPENFGASVHNILVMKFGGSSLANTDFIRAAAQRVVEQSRRGFNPVVVVSAMAGHTDQLLKLARTMSNAAMLEDARETDVIAAAGEQITSGLMAIALRSQGLKARSFQGHQVKIVTTSVHGNSDVLTVDTNPLRKAIRDGYIPVVSGFQGVDALGAITTLGRGGSDTTAAVLAAALQSVGCEIYTDVDGVYDMDPKRQSGAEKYVQLTYDQMLYLAKRGAKVLDEKCVRVAKEHRLAIHVRSTFNQGEGTWVMDSPAVFPEKNSPTRERGFVQ